MKGLQCSVPKRGRSMGVESRSSWALLEGTESQWWSGAYPGNSRQKPRELVF